MNTLEITWYTFTENDDIEEIMEVPAKWEICGRCDGNGKHDNPAFSNGITQDEFDEDPDFMEDYFRGVYDVGCEKCRGSGKILVPDEKSISGNKEMNARYQEYLKYQEEVERGKEESRRERELELKMCGCWDW